MDPTVFFVSLTTIYGILYFFDNFFKSCMHYPYDAFLRNTGLTVKFLSLRWHTNAFNRKVLRWSTWSGLSRIWLTKSFTIGVFFALSLLPIGVTLLLITIFSSGGGGGGGGGNGETDIVNHFSSSSSSKTSTTNSMAPASQGLNIEIMLPGINLPLEEVGFYILTLLLSTIVHEFGHALAAALEDIPITGFGFQLYFCIPLAYTEISLDQLNSLKWYRKLRILCAGIWHNCLFASLCYLLFCTVGFTTSPLYTYNKHVIITDVAINSPLRSRNINDRGLKVGNIITQINDCNIYDEATWYDCLLKSIQYKPSYCVSSDFIRLNDESIEISHYGTDGTLQCCDNKNKKLYCFEYIDDDLSNDAPVEIPQHVCLDIRETIKDSFGYCSNGRTCDRGFCLRPLLRNKTTILNFKRITSLNDETMTHEKLLNDVIYMGHPADVTRTIKISAFIPKQKLISSFWGDAYALFLKYNIVINIGLALMNAVPCFGLDGYLIINTIVNSFLVNRIVERQKRDVISMIMAGIGTLLLGLAILKLLWLNIFRYLF